MPLVDGRALILLRTVFEVDCPRDTDDIAMALLIDPTLGTNSSTLYVDVDVVYASPCHGNLHVYKKALKSLNVRNVTYVNRIDQAGFRALVKHAVQYPKGFSDL